MKLELEGGMQTVVSPPPIYYFCRFIRRICHILCPRDVYLQNESDWKIRVDFLRKSQIPNSKSLHDFLFFFFEKFLFFFFLSNEFMIPIFTFLSTCLLNLNVFFFSFKTPSRPCTFHSFKFSTLQTPHLKQSQNVVGNPRLGGSWRFDQTCVK